jgi:membrane fusion protein (multidrug efflux system)
VNTPKLIKRLSVFLFVLSFTACNEKKKNISTQPDGQANQQPLAVEALIAASQLLKAEIEVPGTILANESTGIYPEVSGRLVQLNVLEGKFVSQGTLLAKLYDGDLQAQKRKLEVQLKIAEQTEKRQAELLKIQGISQQEYDLSLCRFIT